MQHRSLSLKTNLLGRDLKLGSEFSLSRRILLAQLLPDRELVVLALEVSYFGLEPVPVQFTLVAREVRTKSA